MPALLSDYQLQDHILTLKDSIDEFDQAHGRKLFFFNDACFYDHICRSPHVSGTLDAIEPYIPMRLGGEYLDMFLNAYRNEEEMEGSACFFMRKARVDFVASLQHANTPERWARLLGICGAIRDIKEQLMALAR